MQFLEALLNPGPEGVKLSVILRGFILHHFEVNGMKQAPVALFSSVQDFFLI
jgi:hypothetical protein